MTTITWIRGGQAGWSEFCNAISVAVNYLPGGPHVEKSRTAGRDPVGTITVGGVTLTIRPGQSLIIPDRTRPEEWRVK